MRYVYHYHATWPVPSGMAHVDGIVVRSRMLGPDWADYQKLKRDIFDENGSPNDLAKVTIRSLTLVGQHDDAARKEAE